MNEPTETTQTPQAGSPGCRLIRTGLFSDPRAGRWRRVFIRTGIDVEAPWIQRHIAVCPRCQRRFAHVGRVQVALSLLRSRPMDLSLLGRANAKAISSLQHGVREVAKARALRVITPEPTLLERIRPWRGSLSQAAACLALVTLGKIGVFSSFQSAQTAGQRVMRDYYTNQAGQDLADEVYPTA